MQVGIDIETISRFNNFIDDFNKLNKIYTKNEQCYVNQFSDKLTHLAGLFCAKEAVVKALKVGFGKFISPIDVEILHKEDGSVFVNRENTKLLTILKNRDLDVSISHSQNIATAICIVF